MDVSNEELLDGKIIYGKTPNGKVIEIVRCRVYADWKVQFQGGGQLPPELCSKFIKTDSAKVAIRNYLQRLDKEAALREKASEELDKLAEEKKEIEAKIESNESKVEAKKKAPAKKKSATKTEQ